MTTSVELDGVSAAWEFDDLQTADDNGDRTSGTVVAQSHRTCRRAGGRPSSGNRRASSGGCRERIACSASHSRFGASGRRPLVYTADASNVVRLPANISIENIRVEGSDLVLEQADGTLITIKDAAANVPTFVIGEVEVPRVALLAALEASGVDVAFGADGSIAVSPGQRRAVRAAISKCRQAASAMASTSTDLLPPTALAFPRYEGRELYPSLEEDGEDTIPTIEIVGDAFVVDEQGLPVRGLRACRVRRGG